MLELSDRCNEACVHCYQVQGQKGEMTTAEVVRLLDELAEIGVLFLTLSGGEVTLRRDFLEIVEYARAKRFAVKIYTNALTMTSELAGELGRLAVQEVHVSLYSHRPEVHDAITRVPRSHERTVAGIEALRTAGVAVVVKTPLMPSNVRERSQYVRFVRDLDADFAFDPSGLFAREDGEAHSCPSGLTSEDLLGVLTDRSLTPPRPADVDKRPDDPVCGACRGSVHVEPNGEIRPCTQLHVPCGNVSEGVRTSLLEDPNVALLRDLTWDGLYGCRECDLRHYCSRCHAKALSEGGDAFGPYASGCREARLTYEATRGHAPRIALDPELPDRSDELGPYRLGPDGGYTVTEARQTARDVEMRRRHSWIASGGAKPSNLVPLRLGPRVVGRLDPGED